MPWHGTVFDPKLSFGDIDHPRDAAALHDAALGLAQSSASTQALVQLAPQPPASLQGDSLVDSFVAHPHLRVVGELQPQPALDLFGAVMISQPFLDLIAPLVVAGQLRGFEPACASVGPLLGQHRTVTHVGTTAALSGAERFLAPVARRASLVIDLGSTGIDFTFDRRYRPPQPLANRGQ